MRGPTRTRPSRSSTASGPRCASTVSGWTCPRRSCFSWSAGPRSLACSSARTSAGGWRPTSRSRDWSFSTRCCRVTTPSRSEADVELGGTEQKFNLLFARDLQKAYEVPQQSIVTMPILPGTDGVQKMSKSAGNYVGVTEPPEEMFGKLMSIPDEVMGLYYELLLAEPAPAVHPAEAKRALARRLVERFHDAKAAEAAEAQFDRLHVQREAPEDIPEVALAEIEALNAEDGRRDPPAAADLVGVRGQHQRGEAAAPAGWGEGGGGDRRCGRRPPPRQGDPGREARLARQGRGSQALGRATLCARACV